MSLSIAGHWCVKVVKVANRVSNCWRSTPACSGEVGVQLGVRLPDGAVDLGHVALEAAEAALGHERLEVVEHHGALRRPGKHLERDGRQGEPDAEDDQRDEHIPPHP